MKKVSVIIPVYNSSKHLKECLNSVVNQSYNNLEIIIVDDKSTDNSMSIVNKYNDKRIKIIKLNKNFGVAIARNKGIKAATGSYIAFIDSDDYWMIDKIEKQVKFIEKNNYEFIYSSYMYYNNKKCHVAKVPKMLDYESAIKNTAIFTSTVMFNMSKLSKKDIYMPDIKKGQDTATWWQVLKTGIIAHGMDEVLSIYRVGNNNSLSNNKLKALKRTWNLYKREDICFFKKVFCYICYIYNAIKRRL